MGISAVRVVCCSIWLESLCFGVNLVRKRNNMGPNGLSCVSPNRDGKNRQRDMGAALRSPI